MEEGKVGELIEQKHVDGVENRGEGNAWERGETPGHMVVW